MVLDQNLISVNLFVINALKLMICHKLPHVTAHVTIRMLCFTIEFDILPHVTATFLKEIYTFF